MSECRRGEKTLEEKKEKFKAAWGFAANVTGDELIPMVQYFLFLHFLGGFCEEVLLFQLGLGLSPLFEAL